MYKHELTEDQSMNLKISVPLAPVLNIAGEISKSKYCDISMCGNENKQQPQATIIVHTLYNSVPSFLQCRATKIFMTF